MSLSLYIAIQSGLKLIFSQAQIGIHLKNQLQCTIWQKSWAGLKSNNNDLSKHYLGTESVRSSPDHHKLKITRSTLLLFTTSTICLQAMPGSDSGNNFRVPEIAWDPVRFCLNFLRLSSVIFFKCWSS